MSKTNHRVHKEREGKAPESLAHKKRRDGKQKMNRLTDTFYEDPDNLEDIYEYEEFETFERMKKKK